MSGVEHGVLPADVASPQAMFVAMREQTRRARRARFAAFDPALDRIARARRRMASLEPRPRAGSTVRDVADFHDRLPTVRNADDTISARWSEQVSDMCCRVASGTTEGSVPAAVRWA